MKHHAGLDLAAGADVGQRRRLDRPVLVGRRRADRRRHVLPDPSEVGSVIGLHGDQYDHHNQTRDDCVQDRDRADSEFHSRRSPHVAPILILMLHRYRPELKVAGSSPATQANLEAPQQPPLCAILFRALWVGAG